MPSIQNVKNSCFIVLSLFISLILGIGEASAKYDPQLFQKANSLLGLSLKAAKNGNANKAKMLYKEARNVLNWEDYPSIYQNYYRSKIDRNAIHKISCKEMEILLNLDPFVREQSQYSFLNNVRFKGKWPDNSLQATYRYVDAFQKHVELNSGSSSEFNAVCLYNNAIRVSNLFSNKIDVSHKQYLVHKAFLWSARNFDNFKRYKDAKSAYINASLSGLLAQKPGDDIPKAKFAAYSMKYFVCRAFGEGEAQGLYSEREVANQMNNRYLKACVYENWWR